jgi:lysophospholipase L1-like esterase
MRKKITHSKSLSLWRKLFLSLSTFIIFLGFLELVSFLILKTGVVQLNNSKDAIDIVYDYDTIFFNKPNQTACGRYRRVRECHYRTNSAGFRQDEEIPEAAEEGEFRIFCVGDSSTLGFFVDQHQTYPYQLQQLLDKRTDSNQRYKVINAGCVGFTSFQASRLLERWLPRIKPDLVILSVGFNEGTEARKSDKDVDYHNGSFSWLMNFIRNTSFYTVINKIFVLNKPDPVIEGNRLRVDVSDYGIYLGHCVNLAHSYGAEIVFLPISVQRPYIGMMQEVAADRHVPLINTEESLWRAYSTIAAGTRGYGGRVLDYIGTIGESYFDYAENGETRSADMRTKSFVFNDYIHPNPIGYHAIAEDLAKVIP